MLLFFGKSRNINQIIQNKLLLFMLLQSDDYLHWFVTKFTRPSQGSFMNHAYHQVPNAYLTDGGNHKP